MAKPRIQETNEGIQGELTVEIYDAFSRGMRDRGWNNVDLFIKSGIDDGSALEVGPGPGYAGLEWLKNTANTSLTGCEISPDMISLAGKNARDYGLESRAQYVSANAMAMPFDGETFDAAFSNGSMHEWEDPVRVFNEIFRVLKPGGRVVVSDMRRDVNPLVSRILCLTAKPKEIRPGFWTSLYASYTVCEMNDILKQTRFTDFSVQKNFFGLTITGRKTGIPESDHPAPSH